MLTFEQGYNTLLDAHAKSADGAGAHQADVLKKHQHCVQLSPLELFFSVRSS